MSDIDRKTLQKAPILPERKCKCGIGRASAFRQVAETNGGAGRTIPTKRQPGSRPQRSRKASWPEWLEPELQLMCCMMFPG